MDGETTRKSACFAKRFYEGFPGFPEVNGDRPVELYREPELDHEYFVLLGVVPVFQRMVQADFADRSVGKGRQEFLKSCEPVIGSFLNVPRMETEGGYEFAVRGTQFYDRLPVVFGAAAAEQCGYSGSACVFKNGSGV